MPDIEFVDHSTVTLYRASASDLDAARAAWVSQSADAHEKEAEEGRVARLIEFLLRNKHTSPFEHGQFTFVVHTPLFVAREFMRHRTMSYNEVSGRYTELDPEFYVPNPEARPLQQTGKVGAYKFEPGNTSHQLTVNLHHTVASTYAWELYQSQLGQGIAKEVARMVLPLNLMTTFWATCSPLNLMRFLDLRTDPTALYEIRDVASQMEAHLAEAMPLTYAAWKAHGL